MEPYEIRNSLFSMDMYPLLSKHVSRYEGPELLLRTGCMTFASAVIPLQACSSPHCALTNGVLYYYL